MTRTGATGADAGIRVLIVDDHALVREGIRQVLSIPGFTVVGEAGSGEECLDQVRALLPDVVVLDVSLPGGNGIETAARLRTEAPDVRILMLSVHDHPEYVLESARAGAHGYLRKDTLPAELRDAIRAIHGGMTAFADLGPGQAESLRPVLSGEVTARLDLLTRRERDVLVGVASGLSNKEIAARYDLSVRTVESYRESLQRKLGIQGAAGLTRFALEARLLTG